MQSKKIKQSKLTQKITSQKITPHERHSEGGTTVETLSKHCKIPRCDLNNGIMGKTQNKTSHFKPLRNYNNLDILAVLTYQLKIVCLKVALHL